MADRKSFTIPEGWELVTDVKRSGATVKYYTNAMGQRFYSEEDLMRNIKDAKAKGFAIYAPDFDPTQYVGGKLVKNDTDTPSSVNKEKPGSDVSTKRTISPEHKASCSKKLKEVVSQSKKRKTSNTSKTFIQGQDRRN